MLTLTFGGSIGEGQLQGSLLAFGEDSSTPVHSGPNSFPFPPQPEGRAPLRGGRGEESKGER